MLNKCWFSLLSQSTIKLKYQVALQEKSQTTQKKKLHKDDYSLTCTLKMTNEVIKMWKKCLPVFGNDKYTHTKNNAWWELYSGIFQENNIFTLKYYWTIIQVRMLDLSLSAGTLCFLVLISRSLSQTMSLEFSFPTRECMQNWIQERLMSWRR